MTAPQRGFNMLIDTRYGTMCCNRYDIYVSGSLIHYGEYSELEMALLRSLLPVGGVVLQVGAHCGSLTIPLAQHVGEDGMVIAFEPQRLPFQLLCANVALASLANVITKHAAVGQTGGVGRVESIDPRAMYNTGGIRLNATPDGEAVQIISLDETLSLVRCDLLHADVEGMEEDVLRGAEQIIRRHRPVLYVESIDDDKRASLCWYIRSLGYTLFHHDPPMYNPDNYAGFGVNFLGGVLSCNIVGLVDGSPIPTDPYLRPVAV